MEITSCYHTNNLLNGPKNGFQYLQFNTQKVTLITLFNKHCNIVDYCPKLVLDLLKSQLTFRPLCSNDEWAKKLKTNNKRQPEVYFNDPALTQVEVAVTFLMDSKNLFKLKDFDEKVINLDKLNQVLLKRSHRFMYVNFCIYCFLKMARSCSTSKKIP